MEEVRSFGGGINKIENERKIEMINKAKKWFFGETYKFTNSGKSNYTFRRSLNISIKRQNLRKIKFTNTDEEEMDNLSKNYI